MQQILPNILQQVHKILKLMVKLHSKKMWRVMC